MSALRSMLAAGPKPATGLQTLHRETRVAAPLDEAFAFFADAANLERLTPPWLRFEILTPMPVAMRQGLMIDYRITLYRVAIPWQSVIDVWAPGKCFVDRQTVGPYRWWRHEHRFEAAPDGGTRVVDHVEYVPRAQWISGRIVSRDLDRIFEYRQEALRRLLD